MPRRRSPVEYIGGNQLLSSSGASGGQGDLASAQQEKDALDRMIAGIESSRAIHRQKLNEGAYDPSEGLGPQSFEVDPAQARQEQEFKQFRSVPGGQQMIDRFGDRGMAARERGRSFLDSVRSGGHRYAAQREATRNAPALTHRNPNADTTSGPAAVAARREAMRQENGGMTEGELRRAKQKAAMLQSGVSTGNLNQGQAAQRFDAFSLRQGTDESDAISTMRQRFTTPSRRSATSEAENNQAVSKSIATAIDGRQKWSFTDRAQAQQELTGGVGAEGEPVPGILDDPFLNADTGIGVTGQDSFEESTDKLMANWDDVTPEDLTAWVNYFSRMQASSNGKWAGSSEKTNDYGGPAMHRAIKDLAKAVASGDNEATQQAMAAARHYWLFYKQSRKRKARDGYKRSGPTINDLGAAGTM